MSFLFYLYQDALKEQQRLVQNSFSPSSSCIFSCVSLRKFCGSHGEVDRLTGKHATSLASIPYEGRHEEICSLGLLMPLRPLCDPCEAGNHCQQRKIATSDWHPQSHDDRGYLECTSRAKIYSMHIKIIIPKGN